MTQASKQAREAANRLEPKFPKAILRNQETLATLRSLRDCGLMMARGPIAQRRFQRIIRLGYATGKGNRSRAVYRLNERGRILMGESQ